MGGKGGGYHKSLPHHHLPTSIPFLLISTYHLASAASGWYPWVNIRNAHLCQSEIGLRFQSSSSATSGVGLWTLLSLDREYRKKMAITTVREMSPMWIFRNSDKYCAIILGTNQTHSLEDCIFIEFAKGLAEQRVLFLFIHKECSHLWAFSHCSISIKM